MDFILGPGFTVLHEVVKEAMGGEFLRYKPLEDLKSTLDSLEPLTIGRMEELNKKLDLPEEEVQNLKTQMKKGTELVRKLMKLQTWNCFIRCQYAPELVQLDGSLKTLIRRLELQNLWIVRETLLLTRQSANEVVEADGKLRSTLVQKLTVQLEPSVVKKIFNLARENVGILAGLENLEVREEAEAVKENMLLMARQKLERLLEFEGSIKRQLDTLEGQQEAIIEVVTETFVPIISNTDLVAQPEAIIDVPEETELGRAEESLSVLAEVPMSVLAEEPMWVPAAPLADSDNGGAAVGVVAAFEQLFDTLIDVKDKTTVFKRLLVDLKSTLDSLKPLIEEVKMYTDEELQDFEEQMKNGAKLVKNCFKIGWRKSYKKDIYTNQLLYLNKSLNRLLGRLSVQEIRDKMETVRSIWTEVGQIEFEMDAWYAVPKPPPLVVGLDRPLKELKRMLLKDGESRLVICAPGGCGKTTLATKFCQDEEVKGVFKNNIFFVEVSKKPKLDLIVQKLHHHMNAREQTFPSEAIAVKWLERFLNDAGQNPLLLVLDNVSTGSESLLQKFDEFKMPNYKILVTSRSEFPEFGCSYHLNLLNHYDAVTLFRYSASLGDRSSPVPEDLARQLIS